MIAIGGTKITKAYLGQTELKNVAIGDELLLSQASPYDEYGYIAAGKVFHLDGINKGDNATAWTDLVTGIAFPLTSHSTSESDGVRFDGKGLLVSSTTISRTVIPINTSTIEMVYEPYASQFFMWGVGSNSSPQFVKNNANAIGLNFKNGFADDGFVVMSCNVNAGVGGGVVLERGSSALSFNVPYQANPYIWIGGRNYGGQYYYKGKIMCIRAYDRLLTTDEMIHNQQVDNTRFNLGLTI